MGNPPAIGSSRDKCHPQIRYHQDLELQIASQIYSPEYKHQSEMDTSPNFNQSRIFK